ncbi:MAG: DUF4397 domain-containing protein [Acidimicrobiales bacterium]|nr:DUF4397 domain-containing protein [Acidimicrobiales bacterium]RZV48672.1 MAG: DUF4397 domain-containing protein [Acidimicrobiales bacterium]
MKLRIAFILALVAALFAPAAAGAQDAARIHLIHGIPDTAVDVAAGGDVVIPGFNFGDTQDLSGFAGTTLPGVQVLLEGTDTVAIDIGDLPIPASGNITAIAHLDAEGTPTVSIFSNDVSEIAAGQGRITVRHTAAAPAVDILADGAVAFSNVPNGEEGGLDLPAGTISAEVVPTGETEPVVIGPAPLPIGEGSSLIVYAVGSLEGGSLTVLTETIDGLGAVPALVNAGNSPVSSSNPLPFLLIAGFVIASLGVAGTRRTATVRS